MFMTNARLSDSFHIGLDLPKRCKNEALCRRAALGSLPGTGQPAKQRQVTTRCAGRRTCPGSWPARRRTLTLVKNTIKHRVETHDVVCKRGFGHAAKQMHCQLLAFLAGADGGTVADDIWVNFGFGHAAKQMHGHRPLLALLAGADGGIVADDIWVNFGFGHAAKQMHCQRPLLALLRGADGGTVADDIWVNFGFGHAAGQMHCQRPLLALLAGADGDIVADDIWVNFGFGHAAKQMHCSCHCWPFSEELMAAL